MINDLNGFVQFLRSEHEQAGSPNVNRDGGGVYKKRKYADDF